MPRQPPVPRPAIHPGAVGRSAADPSCRRSTVITQQKQQWAVNAYAKAIVTTKIHVVAMAAITRSHREIAGCPDQIIKILILKQA